MSTLTFCLIIYTILLAFALAFNYGASDRRDPNYRDEHHHKGMPMTNRHIETHITDRGTWLCTGHYKNRPFVAEAENQILALAAGCELIARSISLTSQPRAATAK